MQLFIRVKLDHPLSLPLAHHHILQGAIYRLGMGPEESGDENLHEKGYSSGKREYRLFCFSTLEGPHRVESGRIEFFHYVSFEVRSVDSEWICNVEKNAARKGIRLGRDSYEIAFMQRSFAGIFADQVAFTTASPITVHTTDPETKHTKYYAPNDSRFDELINGNFHRKYRAFMNEEADGDIHIECLNPEKARQYKTWYKNFCIIGWKGKFCISGKPEHLSFLYETGIGDRNPQGFGLMKIVD